MRKAALLLFVLLFSLKIYSQDDSIPLKPSKEQQIFRQVGSVPVLQFKVNPLLMISQLELGGIFEYSINKFSVEIGGGVVMPIHDYGSGYAIRAGGRYYTKSGVYFNLVAFYRNMRYSHRNYYSSTNTDFSEEIGEPFQYRTSPANGGADRSWERHCSEKKQVMAFEFLIGKRTSWFDGVPVDAYIGLGYRYKYKQQEVSSDKIGDVKVYYSPPINETIQGFVPTFHLGFQIEIPIIKRKD